MNTMIILAREAFFCPRLAAFSVLIALTMICSCRHDDVPIVPEPTSSSLHVKMKDGANYISSLNLIEGDAVQLVAETSPASAVNESVSWSSDNSGIATVDTNGAVTAVSPGRATINAAVNGGMSVVLTVNVGSPLFPAADKDNTFTVMDKVIFYDFYAKTVSEPISSPGVIRISNGTYVKKLSDDELAKISNGLDIKIIIGARCDNYDRIGRVSLVLIPKGSAYSEFIGIHIEMGRYITPFMDKNKEPNQVPYLFNVDHLTRTFRDARLRAAYDFYIDFSGGGVPYKAQEQISGCAGRTDTFEGTVEFINKTSGEQSQVPLKLISIAHFKSLNNYKAGETDRIGTTKKTYAISLSKPIKNAKMYLISSNHGANTDGEEYNRRDHYVYLDGVEILKYKPGGISCEPFRQYNTQGNGIYGTFRSEESWIADSNWCPGDVIPTRTIDIGDLAAGEHILVIDVPDARFVNGEGNIPHSIYIQGEL